MNKWRTCTKCGEEYSEDSIHWKRKAKVLATGTCKYCANNWQKSYYRKNKEKYREKNKKYREDNREYFRNYRKNNGWKYKEE